MAAAFVHGYDILRKKDADVIFLSPDMSKYIDLFHYRHISMLNISIIVFYYHS